MTSHFVTLSRTEKFPLITRHNRARFGLDPIRDSTFPKNYTDRFQKDILLAIVFPIRN